MQDIKTLNTEELKDLQKLICEELSKRDTIKKREVINKFKEIFKEVQDLGIDIKYSCYNLDILNYDENRDILVLVDSNCYEDEDQDELVLFDPYDYNFVD